MSPFEAKKNAEAANHIVGIDAEVHELDWCSFDNADLARLLQNVDCIVGIIISPSHIYSPKENWTNLQFKRYERISNYVLMAELTKEVYPF